MKNKGSGFKWMCAVERDEGRNKRKLQQTDGEIDRGCLRRQKARESISDGQKRCARANLGEGLPFLWWDGWEGGREGRSCCDCDLNQVDKLTKNCTGGGNEMFPTTRAEKKTTRGVVKGAREKKNTRRWNLQGRTKNTWREQWRRRIPSRHFGILKDGRWN